MDLKVKDSFARMIVICIRLTESVNEYLWKQFSEVVELMVVVMMVDGLTMMLVVEKPIDDGRKRVTVTRVLHW